MKHEIYIGINEFPNYEINQFGKVRNKKTGRVLKSFIDKDGYHCHTLILNLKRYWRNVNRLVAIAFHGQPPSQNYQAAHNDGNPSNNYYLNIRWATIVENHSDKILHGTSIMGENNPKCKLTTTDVIQIRKLNPIGRERTKLAKEYNVSYYTISDILSNKTWKNL